jgi:aspartate 1-decarboxylase
MQIILLKSKIHRATVTQADLNYVGSITIDSDLLRESGIQEYEKVEIADITNGNRLETYAIAGEAGSGIICLNGAAAKLVNPGDKIIIMAYANMTPEEARSHKPTVIFVDDNNAITRKANYEKHGLLC